jgi:hypothetical protein
VLTWFEAGLTFSLVQEEKVTAEAITTAAVMMNFFMVI